MISAAAFDQEALETARVLSKFGEVAARRDGRSRLRLSFVVDAPGYGEPTEAVFEFHEWYQRTRDGWMRDRYSYEFRPRRGRRAHHMGHAGLPRPHQHCEVSATPTGVHYEDYERLLRPVVDELAALYASGRAVDCAGLRPL